MRIFNTLIIVCMISCKPLICSAQVSINYCGYYYLNELSKNKHSGENLAFIGTQTNKVSKQSILPITDTIPVIFHLLLSSSQISQLGGEVKIKEIIDSQILYLNKDFNALNADSSSIPAPFKKIRGSVGLYFALAHTTPEQTSSPGYEIKAIDDNGTNINGNYGSKDAFSDAKYEMYGLASWDVSTYLNIWIVNPLENYGQSNLLGLTISPSIAEQLDLPSEEIGIVLNYSLWNNALKHRTLTHELGHFFNLKHIWGDDNGKCVKNGGEDDGISDTPEQANATYGCPSFPKFDNCTYSNSGIMFVNFMDYTNDDCRLMFTSGQTQKIKEGLQAGEYAYSLLLHPEVLRYPSYHLNEDVIIYPNPASDKLFVHFQITSSTLINIELTDIQGKIIIVQPVERQKGFYEIDISNLPNNIYIISLHFIQETITKKIIIYNK